MMPRLGSSSMRRRGRDVGARAIASICPSPRESVPARGRARSGSAGKSVKPRSTTPRRWVAAAWVNVPRVRFSATVRRLKSRRPSGTSARPSRTRSGASRSLTARPANLISPLRGTTSPATVFRSVVFPAPFAPISATISPGSTASETPWRASTPAPYATSTARTSRSAPSRDADGAEADGVGPVPPRGAGSAAPTVVLAEIGLDDRVVPDDLRRRALGDLLSVVEDDDPLGEGHHNLHDVLDHAERQAELAVDPAHQLHRGRRLGGGEPRHGLVEQEQAGVRGGRPRDLAPPLFGPGQGRRHPPPSRREPRELPGPERAPPRPPHPPA